MKYSNYIRIVSDRMILPVLSALLPLLAGCGDFFAQKPTALHAKAIIDEVAQVRESPHVSNPLPDIYRQPPSRLKIKDGTKLFYFTRHHSAGQLAALVQQQLGVQSSVNAATNQLVLYCTDDAQADAVEGYLEMIDVPPVQVNIDCLIIERFGDITMDWETSIMIQNLLGENITMGENRGTFAPTPTQPGQPPEGALIGLEPAFPGASLREIERSTFGMDFGYWRNQGVAGHQFRAVVDVLISQGYLKILLNPTLETVNAQPATVTIKDHAPIEVLKTGRGGISHVYNITEYVWVENTLSVTPFVYSDGSIGLTTKINVGSRSKPEGVVQRSIITERSIDVAENRIQPGESLIIGGMRKSEKRSVIRGIPFFRDLPLVGVLFSSKDFEEKATEIMYILTPSISSGGREHREIVQEIRDKHAAPDYRIKPTQLLTEPFEPSIYGSLMEQRAQEIELERLQAELDREEAMERAQTERQRADRIAAEAAALRQKALQLRQKAQKAAQEAQAAAEKATAAETRTEAERQQVAELQKQQQEAQTQAQAARQQAEQAAQEAAQATQQAIQAQQSLQAARQAAEEAEQKRQDAQRQAEEAARQRELEQQREIERQQELERQREIERQQELERQREIERQRQHEQQAEDGQEAQQAPEPNES